MTPARRAGRVAGGHGRVEGGFQHVAGDRLHGGVGADDGGFAASGRRVGGASSSGSRSPTGRLLRGAERQR